MNKLAIFAVAMAAGIASGAQAMNMNMMSKPMASEGLYKLATTGWADGMSGEGKGVAYDEIGGKPGAFVYEKDFSASEAAAASPSWVTVSSLLLIGLMVHDGKDYIMVAPHLIIDGELVKGANPNKDHFIVVDADGNAVRYDYSDDIDNKMMMDM